MDDVKNILFATYSYEEGLKASYKVGAHSFLTWLGINANILAPFLPKDTDIDAQIRISTSSGNWLGFIDDVTSSTPKINKVIKIIKSVGLEKFLDSLIGLKTGEYPAEKTTSDNFVERAYEFFNEYESAELRNMEIDFLPDNVDGVVDLVQDDADARVALGILSPIKVINTDEKITDEFKLASVDDPDGMSEQ